MKTAWSEIHGANCSFNEIPWVLCSGATKSARLQQANDRISMQSGGSGVKFSGECPRARPRVPRWLTLPYNIHDDMYGE